MSETVDTRDREVVIGLRDEIVKRIFNGTISYIEKTEKNTYEVYARNLHFVCCYTDDELERIAELCLDLLEELRCINENGYTRAELEKAEEQAQKEDIGIIEPIMIYDTFKTPKTEDIICMLGVITRVGGAYYMILSRPGFISGIYSVFKAIIDKFDDVELYFTALYMLIRVAMHMHCNEIDDEEKDIYEQKRRSKKKKGRET